MSHSTSIFTLWRELARALHRLGNVAVERGEMVVLDQHGGRQIHAVVVSAAGAHRVLLELTPAGRRLARVENLRARTLHRRDELRRERRDPRESLQESSARRAPPRAARARCPFTKSTDAPDVDAHSVFDVDANRDLWIEQTERRRARAATPQMTPFSRATSVAARAPLGDDRCDRREIVERAVLLECAADERRRALAA